MIVTELLDPDATALPSPNQLRGRIIIKHKKIEEAEKTSRSGTLQKLHSSSDSAKFQKTGSVSSLQVDDELDSFMQDLSNQKKNGYLYMQDPIDKVRERGRKRGMEEREEERERGKEGGRERGKEGGREGRREGAVC